MNKIKHILLVSFVIWLDPSLAFSQYSINGSSTQDSCNCFTLTKATNVQAGSVWASSMIDLNNSFDFYFDVFLGCNDSPGADGIVFVMQQEGLNALGGNGSALGYGFINSPSVGIEIDTYGDPGYDHIAIQKNGNFDHLNSSEVIANPIPASGTNVNIEDCQWHSFRVSWDAAGKWLRVYFDNFFRVQVQYDLFANVFSSSPLVYWGFTGGTGGEFNLQKFCVRSTSLLNAYFTTDANNNTVCYGTPVTFSDSSWSSQNIQSFFWDFGDGTYSQLQNPPPHYYAAAGSYTVKQIVTGSDNCSTDTISKTIIVIEAMAFAGNDTSAFFNSSLQLFGNGGAIYSWSPPTGLNNPAIQNPVTILQNDITYLLTVTTPEGCVGTDDIIIKVFKETAIYVPTGFTPNNDGLNEVLKPKYVGIRKLHYFRIFNRWGQLVFFTNDLNKGWDGNLNGVRQQTGVYVWMIKAEDITGKIYELKGTSTIIR